MENDPPIQPPQSLPIEPSQSFLSKHMTLIAIILITAVIASGATYAILSLQGKPSTQPQPSTAQLPPPTPTPDATTNWETYSNSKYSFSIKYPPRWKLDETTFQEWKDEVIIGTIEPPDNEYVIKYDETYCQDIPVCRLISNIEIHIFNTPFAESIYKSHYTDQNVLPVNGIKGYYYLALVGGGPSYLSFDLPFPDGKKFIQLQMRHIGQEYLDKVNKKYNSHAIDIDESTYKQILSTFKFN